MYLYNIRKEAVFPNPNSTHEIKIQKKTQLPVRNKNNSFFIKGSLNLIIHCRQIRLDKFYNMKYTIYQNVTFVHLFFSLILYA